MESRPRLSQAHRSKAACKGCKTIGSSGDCGKQSRTRPNSSPARLAHTATQAQAHRACLFQKCLKSNSYMKPPLCEQVDSMSKRMSKGCPGEQNITASRLGHAGQSATSKSPVLSLHKGAHWSVSSVLSPQTGGFLIACHLPGLSGEMAGDLSVTGEHPCRPSPEPRGEPGLRSPRSAPCPQRHSYSHALLPRRCFWKTQSESLWLEICAVSKSPRGFSSTTAVWEPSQGDGERGGTCTGRGWTCSPALGQSCGRTSRNFSEPQFRHL